MSDNSDSENDSEDGYCVGETFKCNTCEEKIKIENDNCPGGDRQDCATCDNATCYSCIAECAYCNDRICDGCSRKCASCTNIICTAKECKKMTKRCKNCNKMNCCNCENKCKCMKKGKGRLVK